MTFEEKYGRSKIKALSWKQPYARLMLHGKIETRTWKTDYRGLVLICASKKSYDLDTVMRISGQHSQRIMAINKDTDLFSYCGCAIAIGRLIDCRRMKPDDEDSCFVRYNPDLFCHVYENVCEIKPIPFKGKQGWSEVSPDFINLIEIKS